MTILRKNFRQAVVPGTPGAPGSPGRPYVPARTAFVTETFCRWVEASGADVAAAYEAANIRRVFGTVGFDSDGRPIYGWITPVNVGVILPAYTYRCDPIVQRYDYPAQPYIPPTPPVPATPAQFIANFSLGWNGRATAIDQMLGSGSYEFRALSSNVGVVVGLSATPQTSGYADILHGFYLAHGIARVFEAGSEVLYVGAFASDQVFKIQRAGDVVHYLIDDVEVYDSPAAVGRLSLAAALYAGGDSIIGATYHSGAYGAGAFQPLDGMAGDDAYTGAIGHGSFVPMTGVGSVGVRGSGALAALVGIGGKAYSIGSARFVPLTGFGEGYLEAPPYALASGSFELMEGAGTMLTGTVGGSASAMPAMDSLGYDRPFGDGRGAMAAITGTAFTYELATEATVFSGAFGSVAAFGLGAIVVVMNSAAQAVGVVTVQSILSDSVLSEADIVDSWEFEQILEALLLSIATGGNLQFDDAGDFTAWALNTTNAGTTRYANYGFNSFARIGTRHFGMKADGIYELAGPTDAGAAVNAAVNFGKNDFGSSMQKAMRDCYVGVASNGNMVLKIVADGQTYYYSTRASSDALKTQRLDVGLGFRANFFELELQNTAGGAFELATIEFTPVELSRRI